MPIPITDLPETTTTNADRTIVVQNGITYQARISSVAGIPSNLQTKWDSTYTSTNSNSANWNLGYIGYTTTNSNSGNWNLGYTGYTTLTATSANWNSVYTTTNSTSASWVLSGGNTYGSSVNIGTKDGYNLGFQTNNIVRATILSSGNVGINTTTPGARLTVNGIISSNNYINTSGNFNADGSGTFGTNLDVGNNLNVNNNLDVTGDITLQGDIIAITGNLDVASIDVGTINSSYINNTYDITASNITLSNSFSASGSNSNYFNGNIGVGTNRPKSTLDVVGAGNFSGTLSASSLSALGTTSNYFNGSVGIGNNRPSEKVTVTGNVSASGAIYGQNTAKAWGQVNGNNGTGTFYNMSVSKAGSPDGTYNITFTNSLPSANYAVVASLSGQAGYIYSSNSSTTGFKITTRDATNAAADRAFSVVVYAY